LHPLPVVELKSEEYLAVDTPFGLVVVDIPFQEVGILLLWAVLRLDYCLVNLLPHALPYVYPFLVLKKLNEFAIFYLNEAASSLINFFHKSALVIQLPQFFNVYIWW